MVHPEQLNMADCWDEKERYEFDAPSHVVDLKQLESTENCDSWFDQQVKQQNCPDPWAGVNEPLEETIKPRGLEAPLHSTDINTENAEASSQVGDNPKTRTPVQNQPRRVSKRKRQRSSPPSSVKRLKNTECKDLKRNEKMNHHKRNASRKATLTCSQSSSATTGKSEEPFPTEKDGPGLSRAVRLSTLHKRKAGHTAAYVPVAQRIMQLENRTPERFRLNSRQSRERSLAKQKGHHLTLTQPCSPNLRTKQRSRPPTVKSSAELEEKEIEELQKMKFKAQKLNKKILENTDCPKKPVSKAVTVQESFTMHIEKRLQERQVAKPHYDEEQQHIFKARELPKNILEGVVGVPDKKVLQPTVPESPAFLLKKRTRLDHKAEEVKPPSPFKAPPVPHFGLPFQPLLQEKHHTEVCPFSFEQREQEKKKLRQEKQPQEVPQFKAQLLPDFETVVLPERKQVDLTKPEPFKLLIDERGVAKNRRWENMVKEEKKKLKKAATFKATPSTVTQKTPFWPKKDDRSAVVPEGFELATERRARERQQFEEMVCEREAFRAQIEEERRREEEKQQKEEIAQLRQDQVHKAQPIRHYKSVEVKKSEVPLTLPKSPKFSDRFRF